jgi:hypothetical protein
LAAKHVLLLRLRPCRNAGVRRLASCASLPASSACACPAALGLLGVRRYKRRVVRGRLTAIPGTWEPSSLRRPLLANLAFQLSMSSLAIAAHALLGSRRRGRGRRGSGSKVQRLDGRS